MGVSDGSAGKESSCNAGDTGEAGFIPELGRDPLDEENGSPPQYSCLKSPMDRGASWVTIQRVAELDMTELLNMIWYVGEKWLFLNVVLICVSLMNEIEFIHVLKKFVTSSFESCQYLSLAHFSMGLLAFPY